MQSKEQLKKFADFSIGDFYQGIFKPYLASLLAEGYQRLDIEPKQGFDCIKRDLIISAEKKLIDRIIKKIESASD